MYLFQRILRKLQGFFRRKKKKNAGFALDVETLRSLEILAESEHRTPEEVAQNILNDALRGHEAQQYKWNCWQSLTPREQEVAALICLNYTSRQIAARLHISPETVKSHVEHILIKFGVPDRYALRIMLSDWDFSDWNR